MKSILIFSIIFINTLFAQNIPKEELDSLSLEELMDIKIYSATKSYQRIEDIPANIIVLTRKDIEKYNYTTLDELLKHVPGLFIIDDTEHFQIGSRGSLGSSFKLMINNNPISPLRVPRNGTSNRNFFATPVESIDRIEIIKGPQAVTYGSNSMYGSINIITNDFNAKNIISVGKGNNGQEKVFARINHKQDNGGFTLNTSFYNTNGISGNLEDSFKKDTSFPSNSVKSLDNKLNNEYKTIDFSHRYKNLTTDIIYSQTKYGLYIGDFMYRNGSHVNQKEQSIAFTYEDEINNNLLYKINFITSKKNYSIDDKATENYILYGNTNHAEDNSSQLDIHLNYKLTEKVNILLGSTFKNFKENVQLINEEKKAKLDYYYKTNESDLYSKLQYKYNDSFEINAGVRFSKKNNSNIHYSLVSLPTNQIIPVNPDPIQSKRNYLPEFSAIYHINSNNHLKFLYGKANQLAYSSLDNYEEIKSSEVNYLHIAKNYQINSSLFYNQAKNISLFTQDETNSATTKKGNKITKGLELGIRYNLNHNFQTSSSITIQDTKNNNTTNSEDYKTDFSPKALAKLNLSYLMNRTRYSLMIDYISKMKASFDTNKNKRIGKDSNHNISVGVNVNHKLNKNLSFNLNINNLLNRNNTTPAGSTLTNFYNGAFTKDREYLLTLKYKF